MVRSGLRWWIGQPVAEYDKLLFPVFSSDGKRMGYPAEKDGKWFAVVDGRPGAKYDQVFRLLFSPDGKRVSYEARKGEKVDGGGGREAGRGIRRSFLPDLQPGWQEVSVYCTEGREALAVVDDQVSAGYDFVYTPRFSPDGKRVAYQATPKSEKALMVVDGQPGPEYDMVTNIVFSPDSKHLTYSAGKDRTSFMVMDGQPVAGSFGASFCCFSPDSKRTAYEAWKVMVVGWPGSERGIRRNFLPRIQP